VLAASNPLGIIEAAGGSLQQLDKVVSAVGANQLEGTAETGMRVAETVRSWSARWY
jgi:hypothetical protein